MTEAVRRLEEVKASAAQLNVTSQHVAAIAGEFKLPG